MCFVVLFQTVLMDGGGLLVVTDVDSVLDLSVITKMDVVRVRLDGLHRHVLVCIYYCYMIKATTNKQTPSDSLIVEKDLECIITFNYIHICILFLTHYLF